MKKYFIGIFTILSLLVLSSCGNEGSKTTTTTTPYTPEIIENNYELKCMDDENTYTMSTTFNTDYFFNDSFEYNKNLSNLSNAMVNMVKDVNTVNTFFNSMRFDEINPCDNYGVEDSSLSLSYTFAKKNIGKDTKLIALSIRGIYYQIEWGNNFNIGSTSHHKGYDVVSDRLLTALNEYIKNETKIKLWICGYSKGGALSDLLTVKIDDLIDEGKFKCSKNDVFTYTFEAPASTAKTDKEYKNIHNLVNEYDLVTYVPPAKYDLIRPGVDHITSNVNYKDVINNANIAITLDDFKVYNLSIFKSGSLADKVEELEGAINDPKDFVKRFTDMLFKESSSEGGYSVETREKYVEKLEEPLVYFVTKGIYAFYNKKDIVVDYFKEKGMTLVLTAVLGGGDSLVEIFEELFTKCEIEYNKEELTNNSIKLKKFLVYVISVSEEVNDVTYNIFTLAGTIIKEFNYILAAHYPEVNVALVKEYNK